MGFPLRRAFAMALVGAAGACGAFTTSDDGPPPVTQPSGPDGGDAEGPATADGAVDASQDGAGATADAGTINGCPADMVRVPAGAADYCIDADETTVGDYRAFVMKNTDPALDPSFCGEENKSYAWAELLGADEPTSAPPGLPWARADYCDARAYCLSRGKRLCGSIGAHPNTGYIYDLPLANPPLNYADENLSEWYRACSGGGIHAFPYGDVYDAATCVTERQPPATEAVPSNNGACQGGYPGIHDMSGNVAEWENACEPATADTVPPDAAGVGHAVTPSCLARGNQVTTRTETSGDLWKCGDISEAMQDWRSAAGIRCCADVTP